MTQQTILFFVIGAVVAMLLLGGGAIGLTVIIRPRFLLRRRMAQIGVIGNLQTSERADSRRQRRIQDQVKQLKKKEKRGWKETINDNIMQAGLDFQPSTYLIGSACLAVIVSFFYLMSGMPRWGAVAAAAIGFFGLPKFILKFMAKRRQKKFTKHFAEAIDVIVRGIRSGLPINECFNVVAREFEPPVSEEFRLMVEGENLGMTLDDLMQRGLRRLPTPEYRFFAIVIQIQRQTGGNLADTLANLSNVLRGRKQLRDKVQAMASEAKASAGIIGSLPFFVTAILAVVNPDYLMLLFTESTGHILLGIGAFWGSLGTFVMHKMIHFKA